MSEKYGKSLAMRTVKVRYAGGADSKYIVTIPKEVSQAMHLKPGMRIMMETDGEQIRITKAE